MLVLLLSRIRLISTVKAVHRKSKCKGVVEGEVRLMETCWIKRGSKSWKCLGLPDVAEGS